MAFSLWQRWMKRRLKPSTKLAPAAFRPRLEMLERRLAPATRVWDGGSSANDNWNDPLNWEGNIAPAPGDDVVFRNNVIASDKITTNNLSFTNIGSLRFEGDNFFILGNALALGPGNIAYPTTGTNTIAVSLTLSGPIATISVPLGGRLVLAGALSGNISLIKAGDGTLELGGANANAYTGTTTVNAGTLDLNKSSGVTAIPGDLTIGDGTAPDIFGPGRDQVRLLNHNQIANDATVTIHTAGQLDLLSRTEGIISKLQMSGGEVTGTSTSALGLKNEYRGVFGPVPVTPAIIDCGQFILQSFQVDFVIQSPHSLEIKASITGSGGLTRTGGGGNLILSGTQSNTYTGTTTVAGGQLTLAKQSSARAISGPLVVGIARGSNAFVTTLAPGQFNHTQPVTVNSNGHMLFFEHDQALGPLTITGGAQGGSIDADPDALDGGKLVFAGDVTVRASSFPARITGLVEFSGPLAEGHSFNVADGAAAEDLIINGTLSINANIEPPITAFLKTGTGTMVVNADASFVTPNRGRILHNEGVLHMNGNNPNVDVLMQSAATLVTDDSASLALVSGGTLSPGGVGAGLLSVGSLGSSNLRIDLNGTQAGTEFDQMRVRNSPDAAVSLSGGALDLHLGFAPAIGDRFKIIDNQGSNAVFGTFTNAQSTITVDGQTFLVLVNVGEGNDIGNDVFLVRDNPPALQNRSITTPIFEGQVATLTGTITEPDAGDTFFLDVNWGDGTPVETYTFPPGSNGQTVSVTHRYLDDGNFNVFALWRDPHGGHNSATLPIEVKNVAPHLTDLRVELDRHHRVTISGRIADPGRDSYTLVVHWGDGHKDTYHFQQGTTEFSIRHRYEDTGRYKVRLKLLDDDGGADRETLAIHLASQRHRRDAWTIALWDFLGSDD